MCCGLRPLEHMFFFHCKKKRVGKKITDKAVCRDCMHMLIERDNTCPFCRSHTFDAPREPREPRKKVSPSSRLRQKMSIYAKRCIAEDHGYRVIGYTTLDQELCLSPHFVLKFRTNDGTTPIFMHKDYCYSHEPTLRERGDGPPSIVDAGSSVAESFFAEAAEDVDSLASRLASLGF